jgi:hypothetical protein
MPVAVIAAIRRTNERYGMFAPSPPQSALMPANLLTLPHFSVSSAISRPKSPELIGIGSVPNFDEPWYQLGIGKASIDLFVELLDDLGRRVLRPTPHQPLAS